MEQTRFNAGKYKNQDVIISQKVTLRTAARGRAPAAFISNPALGGGSRLLAAALCLAGLGMVALGLLMPASWRSIDPAVLAAVGYGTPSLEETTQRWDNAGKPGTAAMFRAAAERLDASANIRPAQPSSRDPALRHAPAEFQQQEIDEGTDRANLLWGGYDPFLEQIFGTSPPRITSESRAVIPLFISRESREQLSNFLSNSRNPAVRAVLSNIQVQGAERFVPASSAAGQPLEATLYLTALLLQGNHLSPSLAARIRALATEAAETNRLSQPLETIYLDLLALGMRLQWQPLVDLAALFDNEETLRRAAHLAQQLGDDWPLFHAASVWTRFPDNLSEFLVDHGDAGVDTLREAMRHGEGAVIAVAFHKRPLHEPLWRRLAPQSPVLFARLADRAPETVASLRLGVFSVGPFLTLLAFGFLIQKRSQAQSSSRKPLSLTLLRALIIGALFTITFILLSEPFITGAGQKPDFSLQPLVTATTTQQATIMESPNFLMDPIVFFSLAIFFVLQILLYVISWIKIFEIKRQPIASNLKIELLANEENLFDAGLYAGISGTVISLILLALGIVQDVVLMTAYASTLFGIVFVAMFKICHLRPYRRRLILENRISDR